MSLSEQAKRRLADIVELQPTKNSELEDRWGLDSGSEVHQYLESELSEYYYRDENSLIRATDDAVQLVDADPAIEQDEESLVIRVPELHHQIVNVLAGPQERSESVVSVLQSLREQYDIDPSTDDIRSALRRLRDQEVVEVVQRTVPTYRLALERDQITVERR